MGDYALLKECSVPLEPIEIPSGAVDVNQFSNVNLVQSLQNITLKRL